MGVLYVLDEPTIGLHARDTDRLIHTLEKIGYKMVIYPITILLSITKCIEDVLLELKSGNMNYLKNIKSFKELNNLLGIDKNYL